MLFRMRNILRLVPCHRPASQRWVTPMTTSASSKSKARSSDMQRFPIVRGLLGEYMTTSHARTASGIHGMRRGLTSTNATLEGVPFDATVLLKEGTSAPSSALALIMCRARPAVAYLLTRKRRAFGTQRS
jgi:hypothetical protein